MTELKTKDIITISSKLKKLGVSKFKFGTLEVEFIQTDENQTRAPRPALKVPKKVIAEQNERNKLQMELDQAKDDISVMHVEDPEGFEQAIIERELTETSGQPGGEQVEEAHGL